MINSGALEEGGGGIDFANIEKRTDSELESRFLDLRRLWIYYMNMLRFSGKGKIDVFEILHVF